jgi:hypothetical protein
MLKFLACSVKGKLVRLAGTDRALSKGISLAGRSNEEKG